MKPVRSTRSLCRRLRVAASALLLALFLGAFSVVAAAGSDTVFSENFEGDFTGCPAGWRVVAGDVQRTTDHASGGSASMMITDSSTKASATLASPKITLESGVYYRISVDVMNLSGNGSVFVYLFGKNGQQTDTVSTTVTETGRWTTAELTVCLPDTAKSIQILLYSGMANKGQTCYDNVRVVRADGDSEQVVHPFEQLVTAHPRLFFTPAELEQLKNTASGSETGLAGYSGKEASDALIGEAAALLSQTSFTMTYYGSTTKTFSIPFTEQHFTSAPAGFGSGNYPYWQEMGNKMKEMLQSLALAYALTGDVRYGDRAVELALSLAAWSTWTEYPSINRTSLETGYFTTGVATVYDLCYDRLSDAQRGTLAEALEKKGLKPLFDDLSAFTDHNYYVNKASALMTGSLVLFGSVADAPKYLSRAYDFASWYLDRRAESEGQEGLSYTSYAMDLLFAALDQLERVTGNGTLMEHAYPESLIRWVVAVSESGEGSAPPVSDSYLDTCFFVTASVMRENDVSALARWYLSSRKPDSVSNFLKLVYYRPAGETETPDAYTARTGIDLRAGVADAAGWGYLRTGWGADDLLLVAVGNNSQQGHSHYDQNSFVLAVGGEWILSDPGYQDYGAGERRDYTLAWGHSTVTVDGKTQSIKGGGSMLVGLNAAGVAVLSSDAAGAYTDPSLLKADRTYLMIRSGGSAYFVLVDDLVSDTAHSYEWNLNAGGIVSAKCYNDGGFDSLKVSGAKLSGNEFFAVGKNRALRIAFDRNLNFSYRACGTSGGVISAKDGSSAESGSFCAVISAMDGKSISSATLGQGVAVVASYSNATQTGVKTSHGGLSDLVLVARGGNALSGGGLTAAARTASLLGLRENGSWSGYAATDATELVYEGRTLLRASQAVSLNVNFDGTAGMLTGAVGTTVRLYAPNGVNGLSPDVDGYCELVLTSEQVVLTAGQVDPAPADSETVTDPTPDPVTPDRGCRSAAGLSLLLPLCLLAIVPAVWRKR